MKAVIYFPDTTSTREKKLILEAAKTVPVTIYVLNSGDNFVVL